MRISGGAGGGGPLSRFPKQRRLRAASTEPRATSGAAARRASPSHELCVGNLKALPPFHSQPRGPLCPPFPPQWRLMFLKRGKSLLLCGPFPLYVFHGWGGGGRRIGGYIKAAPKRSEPNTNGPNHPIRRTTWAGAAVCAPPARLDAQQVLRPLPAAAGSSGRREVAARATESRPARTHGRSAVRAPARSAIRPGPRSARARFSRGPGAAPGALRPLAPPRGARHPPAAADPRAASPLFWSRGPAAPPLTASERGAGQSARSAARAPPRRRAPALRAPRPGARLALAPAGQGRTCRGARRAAIGGSRERGGGGGGRRGGASSAESSAESAARRRLRTRLGAGRVLWPRGAAPREAHFVRARGSAVDAMGSQLPGPTRGLRAGFPGQTFLR